MKDVKQFWIGGMFSTNWFWTNSPKTFTDYTIWEGDVVNIGCIPSSCNSDMALTVSSNYNPDEGEAYPTWIAGDKGFAKPYICQSKCFKGYHWFPESQRCLKVVHTNHKQTLGNAMLRCAKDNARLVPVKKCEDVESLMKEIYEQFSLDQEQYFIGVFGFNKPDDFISRNWREESIFDSLGYGNIDMDATTGSLCEQSISTAPKEEHFTALKIEDKDNMVLEVIQFNQQNYEDPRHEAGYICEKEGL